MRIILISILFALLAACGFHLRGSYQLPAFMQEVVLESSDPNGSLLRDLKRALLSADVALLEKPSATSALLKIEKEETGSRPLSIGSDGRAQENEIYYTVNFSVSHKDLKVETVEGTITLTRDYAFDPSAILGAGGEEELLRKDMRRDLVRLIMQRLAAIKGSTD